MAYILMEETASPCWFAPLRRIALLCVKNLEVIRGLRRLRRAGAAG